MSQSAQQATAWIYEGVWKVLVDLFNVPREAPNTPPAAGQVRSLKPDPAFLRYLKFKFWIALVIIDVLIIGLWLAVLIAEPVIGLIIAPLAWGIAIIPDVLAYVALHLRWDTTWYIITDRSVRIRRGVWQIRESTVTFENVQNVEVRQGPLQRHFGIADVHIQTAGGAAVGPHGTPVSGHHGLLEGLANAAELRELILSRAQRSRSAGLGDEHPEHASTGAPALGPAHVAVLKQIRNLL